MFTALLILSIGLSFLCAFRSIDVFFFMASTFCFVHYGRILAFLELFRAGFFFLNCNHVFIDLV